MEYGFVYCIGNELMPGVYKVGMTDRAPSKRVEELSSSTSVPQPFDLLFFIECANPRTVELRMHQELAEFRVSDNREFFICDLREINKQFLSYRDDGCAYAETSVASSEMAILDYEDTQSKAPQAPFVEEQ